MCREGVLYLAIVPCTIESIFLLRTLVEGYTSLRFPWVRVPHNVWSNEYSQYCIHHYWMMLHHSQALPTHSHSCLVVNVTHLRLIPGLRGNENKRDEYYTMFCGLWYIITRTWSIPLPFSCTVSHRDDTLSAPDVALFPGFPMQEWKMQPMEICTWEQGYLRHTLEICVSKASIESTCTLRVALKVEVP